MERILDWHVSAHCMSCASRMISGLCNEDRGRAHQHTSPEYKLPCNAMLSTCVFAHDILFLQKGGAALGGPQSSAILNPTSAMFSAANVRPSFQRFNLLFLPAIHCVGAPLCSASRFTDVATVSLYQAHIMQFNQEVVLLIPALATCHHLLMPDGCLVMLFGR